MTAKMKENGWTLQNVMTLIGLAIVIFGGGSASASIMFKLTDNEKRLDKHEIIHDKLEEVDNILDDRLDREETDSALKTQILKTLSSDIGEIKDLFKEFMKSKPE